jgi:hypothetical protein
LTDTQKIRKNRFSTKKKSFYHTQKTDVFFGKIFFTF